VLYIFKSITLQLCNYFYFKELDNVQRDQKQGVVTKNAIEVRYVLPEIIVNSVFRIFLFVLVKLSR
jgi:hypothetical protein